MTEKQFWKKLDQIAGHKEKVAGAADLILQAYEQDLKIICGCHYKGQNTFNQLYINVNENEPDREGNRFMLCYTSEAMGGADPLLLEPCEALPVRFVVDNALSKPVIGGLILNRHSKDKLLIIPKQFFDGRLLLETALKAFAKGPNPFNIPWSKEVD